MNAETKDLLKTFWVSFTALSTIVIIYGAIFWAFLENIVFPLTFKN